MIVSPDLTMEARWPRFAAAAVNVGVESALASRDVIGQAKGILMEGFKIDAVRAFGLMTRYSQNSNKKIRTIAQQIVDTA
jgi:AmiR/NasT family two-component response regulator